MIGGAAGGEVVTGALIAGAAVGGVRRGRVVGTRGVVIEAGMVDDFAIDFGGTKGADILDDGGVSGGSESYVDMI